MDTKYIAVRIEKIKR